MAESNHKPKKPSNAYFSFQSRFLADDANKVQGESLGDRSKRVKVAYDALPPSQVAKEKEEY